MESSSRRSAHHYELLHFGLGARLERFGDAIVARDCPVATGPCSLSPHVWEQADHVYSRSSGRDGAWTHRSTGNKNNNNNNNNENNDGNNDNNSNSGCNNSYNDNVDNNRNDKSNAGNVWTADFGHGKFHLGCLAMGQVGVFPEQQANWQWLSQQVRTQAAQDKEKAFRVLNGFAYTGGSTMACAVLPNVKVTHLDAAQVSVHTAKHNFLESSLPGNVRWIVDDCSTFVDREIRRGQKYDGIIFDPPAFGKFESKTWSLDRDLPLLLEKIPQISHKDISFVLLSCHAPKWSAARLSGALDECMRSAGFQGRLTQGELSLKASSSSKKLALGVFARWTRLIR